MVRRSTKKPYLGGGEVKEERGPKGKVTKEGGVEENDMECLGCLGFCNRYFQMLRHFFFFFCNNNFFAMLHLLCQNVESF